MQVDQLKNINELTQDQSSHKQSTFKQQNYQIPPIFTQDDVQLKIEKITRARSRQQEEISKQNSVQNTQKSQRRTKRNTDSLASSIFRDTKEVAGEQPDILHDSVIHNQNDQFSETNGKFDQNQVDQVLQQLQTINATRSVFSTNEQQLKQFIKDEVQQQLLQQSVASNEVTMNNLQGAAFNQQKVSKNQISSDQIKNQSQQILQISLTIHNLQKLLEGVQLNCATKTQFEEFANRLETLESPQKQLNIRDFQAKVQKILTNLNERLEALETNTRSKDEHQRLFQKVEELEGQNDKLRAHAVNLELTLNQSLEIVEKQFEARDQKLELNIQETEKLKKNILKLITLKEEITQIKSEVEKQHQQAQQTSNLYQQLFVDANLIKSQVQVLGQQCNQGGVRAVQLLQIDVKVVQQQVETLTDALQKLLSK